MNDRVAYAQNSLFTIHNSLFGAPSPEVFYKSGDFQTAESAWRNQTAAAPTDWAARHNLSLALAQQDRWPEAAAQAVAAFVQRPSDPAVRRNVILALAHAGYTPAPVSEIAHPGPVSEIALRLSPPQWQCALVLSIALAGLAFALLLVRAYTRRQSGSGILPLSEKAAGRRFHFAVWHPALRRFALIAACVLFVIAILGTIISAFGLHAYGPARDARAVIVWRTGTLRSIPTVADTTQKTTPLPAGTIAIADKKFPGWLRLVFADGQTGWTPAEDTVALWK